MGQRWHGKCGVARRPGGLVLSFGGPVRTWSRRQHLFGAMQPLVLVLAPGRQVVRPLSHDAVLIRRFNGQPHVQEPHLTTTSEVRSSSVAFGVRNDRSPIYVIRLPRGRIVVTATVHAPRPFVPAL